MDNLEAKIWFTIPESKLVMDENAQELVGKGEAALTTNPDSELYRLNFEQPGGDRYVVFNNRQKGGMAFIYKGADMHLHIPVAVKVLEYEPQNNSVLPAMLEKEAKSQARLNHPNIVKIHNIIRAKLPDRSKPENIIILEWMDPGEYPTLNKLIESGKSKDPKLILRVARSLGNAVSYMAGQNFYHRDIKPGNIFVGERLIKIGDFGIGNWVIDPAGSALGSPAYMSPEAIEAEEVDQRSEVFSMAQTIYAMIAGRAPFEVAKNVEKTKEGILFKDYPPLANEEALKDQNPKMLSELDKVLSKAMQKDASLRYQTAAELADAIETALTPFVAQEWLKKYRLYYGL